MPGDFSWQTSLHNLCTDLLQVLDFFLAVDRLHSLSVPALRKATVKVDYEWRITIQGAYAGQIDSKVCFAAIRLQQQRSDVHSCYWDALECVCIVFKPVQPCTGLA